MKSNDCFGIQQSRREQTINKIIVINDLAEVADFINFLSPFSKMSDIKCVCVKPYINIKIKKYLKQRK